MLLLSSVANNNKSDTQIGKSEIILDCNLINGGVNSCGEICEAYWVFCRRTWCTFLRINTIINTAEIHSRALFVKLLLELSATEKSHYWKHNESPIKKEWVPFIAQIYSLYGDAWVFLGINRSNKDLEEEISIMILVDEKGIMLHIR